MQVDKCYKNIEEKEPSKEKGVKQSCKEKYIRKRKNGDMQLKKSFIQWTIITAATKAIISPLCSAGNTATICSPINDIMSGGVGGSIGGMAGGSFGGFGSLGSLGSIDPGFGVTCHVSNGGIFGSTPISSININPCTSSNIDSGWQGLGGGSSIGIGSIGNIGSTSGIAASIGGSTGALGASNTMLCSTISLPDRGVNVSAGSMWPNDCYSKISSIFMNGFITGQKANDICCAPSSSLLSSSPSILATKIIK